jgi:hypothetical protein
MLYKGTIVIDVPYKGKWYSIDSLRGNPELYENSDVPNEVVSRAISALDSAWAEVDYVPTKEQTRSICEEALRKEFGEARFVRDTYPYGVAF